MQCVQELLGTSRLRASWIDLDPLVAEIHAACTVSHGQKCFDTRCDKYVLLTILSLALSCFVLSMAIPVCAVHFDNKKRVPRLVQAFGHS